ncbi:hypothetical protein PV11_07206 [Exophiala sideris]|uniref:Beta-glucuronidase C-terminal domain-containing protein n=1 Tax=Exophiala sideris TaxID=1016849 RepID=A0A0D1Y9N5_9EURO|nr:hypothetical protein PV11_07206 [Exophiala sideris]
MWILAGMWLAIALLDASVNAFSYDINVSAELEVPPGSSKAIQHDFASFSLPAHFFADYAGNHTHPNLFSRDIFDLLYNKTGSHPFVRVGGTSTDRVWYNASQEPAFINEYSLTGITAELGIATRVSVGPIWFEGFQNFPSSRWSYQVNMGSSYNETGGLENALQVARLVMDAVRENLDAFEIGNEPELMALVGVRTENYTVDDYVLEWNLYADAISAFVLKGNPYGLDDSRFFQAFTIGGDEEPWTGLDVWKAGIDRGDHVKSVSFHQYAASNQAWVRLQDSYMNHTANKDNLTQYVPEIEYASQYDPFIPLVLGETNSNSYNLNMSQIEGVFGSALWLIDHLMMGMALNITRYNLIQGTTFGYSAWVPVPSGGRQPYVRAPLYGQIFTADALGHHPQVQVKALDADLPWNMSAYAFYEGCELAKYAIINLDEWNSTSSYERPSQQIQLTVPNGETRVRVERLTGDGASADQGIEWAGLSWNYTDGRLLQSGEYHSEWLDVGQDGKATLTIPSTQAVLITLNGTASDA